MIKKIKNQKILEIIFLILISSIPLFWLKDSQTVFGHDSGFRLDSLGYYHDLFYSWSPITNFGIDWSILKGFLIAQFPETFFRFITHSMSVGERLTFIFWFFMMGLSMYIFINNFFPQKKFWIFRLFSSTFYMYNFFILQAWFITERAKFSLYAALPIGLLLIYKLLKWKYPLAKGIIFFSFLFFFFNGGGNPTLYASEILVYGIAFIYITFINVLKNGKNEMLYSLKVFILIVISFFFINAYWVLPQIYLILNKYTSSLITIGGISGVLEWEHVVNQYASLINLFRLEGIPDWYNNINHVYSNYYINNSVLIILSFLPIFIISSGAFLHKTFKQNRESKELFYLFFSIFLIGIIFTAGSHPPLGFFYISLIKHIPGFAIFRSAFYKFGSAYWFSFIFLCGYFLNLFLQRFEKRRLLYLLSGLTFIIFVLIYHFPYFVSNFFEFNKPFTTKVNIPKYVKEMSIYVNKKTSIDSRILILPKLYPDFLADSYNWGFWSLDLLPRLSIERSIIANDSYSPDIISNIYNTIDNKDENTFLKLTGLTGINKILWRNDVLYTDKKITSNDLINVENNLKSFKSVSLEKEFGEWRIYKITNSYYEPIFYVPQEINSADAEKSVTGYIVGKTQSYNPLVLFLDETSNNNELNHFVDNYYAEANCILCTNNELQNIEDKITLPYVRFLPGSRFYFVINYLENRSKNKFKNNSKQMIDVNLSLSNTRLAEIFKLLIIPRPDRKMKVSETVGIYKGLIDNSIKNAGSLNFYDKNYYFIRILAYLQKQNQILENLSANRENLFEETYLTLFRYQQEKIKFLKKNVWATDYKNKSIKYIVNLPKDAKYNLLIDKSSDNQRLKILLDGIEISNYYNLNINKGFHTLEIIMTNDYSALKKDVYSHIHMDYPKVLLQTSNVNTKKYFRPSIKFLRINLAKYSVSVENSKTPFILSFGESFDRGWKAYYLNNKGYKIELSEKFHFQSNGYANAWIIDKKGSYQMLIEYHPQEVFKYGLIVTMLTIIFFVYILTKLNEKIF